MNAVQALFLTGSASFFAVLHRRRGPLSCMQSSQRLALLCLRLQALIPRQTPKLELSKLKTQLSPWDRCLAQLPALNCLEKACALQLYLALHGQKARLVLGKRLENGQVLLHAWLSCDGEKLYDDPRFQEISLPSAFFR